MLRKLLIMWERARILRNGRIGHVGKVTSHKTVGLIGRLLSILLKEYSKENSQIGVDHYFISIIKTYVMKTKSKAKRVYKNYLYYF